MPTKPGPTLRQEMREEALKMSLHFGPPGRAPERVVFDARIYEAYIRRGTVPPAVSIRLVQMQGGDDAA